MNLLRLDSRDRGFHSRLAALTEFDAPDVEAGVRAIVEDVRTRGDEAVVEHTNRLDGRLSPFTCLLAFKSLSATQSPGISPGLPIGVR